MTTDASPLRHANCATCGSLRDDEHGYQKYGWEQDDVYLPAAARTSRRSRG